MSRRDNAAERCPGCRLHKSLCACALIPRIETTTKVVLFIHHFEDRKSTNTGRLATRCLSNSEVFVRGRESAQNPSFTPTPGTRPLLLFPHEGALPLGSFAGSSEPLVLVVPDGNWRQAFKVRNRVPGLRELPCVYLPRAEPSKSRLRFESSGIGLSTFEAIARALGVIEGLHVQRALERIFDTVVERALWSRGAIKRAEVTGGVPEGVERHDPRGRLRPP